MNWKNATKWRALQRIDVLINEIKQEEIRTEDTGDIENRLTCQWLSKELEELRRMVNMIEEIGDE